MNPSEFQLSGTRDANGEIKISAQEAMNPKEHKFIKFDNIFVAVAGFAKR
jgi:hypothetical protein